MVPVPGRLSLQDPVGKIKVVALDEITHRVRGKRRYTLAAQDGERGDWLAMRVSQGRDEEAWVALLDELWEMGISPDSGVRWVVRDGDLAIEAGVEIVGGSSPLLTAKRV